MKALLFESLALRILASKVHSFRCVTLAGDKTCLQLGNFLTMGELNMQTGLDDKQFLEALNHHKRSNDNVLLVPSNERYPAIDAAAVLTMNGKRIFLFLQVSIAMHHGITAPAAEDRLKELVEIAGGVKNCALIFALPNNRVFNAFKKQEAPTITEKAIGQYKIALQSVEMNMPPKKKK